MILNMIIREANLALRFYVSDGWTRSAVAELQENVELFDVIPRYFDARDEMTNDPSGKHRFEIEGEFKDCDYYAVYNKSKWWIDKNYLADHAINYIEMY